MTIYFDMDGVLAVFDEDCPKSVVWGRTHYFRTCEADPRAVSLFHIVSRPGRIKTKVFTRLLDFLDKETQKEQTQDKLLWCKDNLGPTFHERDFIHTNTGKAELLLPIPENQRTGHILIDDDPVILRQWRDAGGTGLQYLQRTRRVSQWNGPVILPEHHTLAAALMVSKLINDLN